jgi:transposase
MLPPVGSCHGCRLRQRELNRLRQHLEQRERDDQRLERRLARLKKDNSRLRQELDEARRQAHRQAGHFRRRKLKKRKNKPGRKAGHPASLRPTPPPERIDRVVPVLCPVCPDCKVPLVDPKIVVQYQTDLPPIVPIVTQFNIETGWCPCCRQRRQSRHPEQTSDAHGAAGNTFGAGILTMAGELKHRLGVPYRKICDFLETYCGIHAAPATFVRAEQRLAERAKPTYNLLIDALRRCHIVHADETGWRINALSAWLWVFSNKHVTIYTIRTGPGARGHEVPQDILGPDFDGYLIVDGGKAYECLSYSKGQCNAHLLRRTHELGETASPREQAILQTLSTLIQEAIDLAERRPTLTAEGYSRRVQEIDNRLENWLVDQYSRWSSLNPDLQRLLKHVANHRDQWLLFLHDPEVPPTNNHAERMLRPAVITRKVGGCNKTLLGALVHSILASLMVTCKQQGLKFLEVVRRLWSTDPPPAIPLVPLPNPATPAGKT